MELFDIVKDVKDGGLEREEIPGFAAWMFRKLAWLFILITVIGAVLLSVQ